MVGGGLVEIQQRSDVWSEGKRAKGALKPLGSKTRRRIKLETKA